MSSRCSGAQCVFCFSFLTARLLPTPRGEKYAFRVRFRRNDLRINQRVAKGPANEGVFVFHSPKRAHISVWGGGGDLNNARRRRDPLLK